MLSAMHPSAGPLTRLRREHEELVLSLLRKHGPLSRGELGTRCGLSRTTLYDIVGDLIANGAVVAAVPLAEERRRGRPVEKLSLNPDAGHALGIDFARRAVHVAAVNVAHEIVGSASEQHAPDLSWEERVRVAERLVGTLTGGALRLGALGAIGVGVVGPIGAPGDRTAGGRRLDVLSELLRKSFGVPVLLDNNTRLAALAEATWGAAADDADVLYLRVSHGVGGGLIVGGSLHRGAFGLSGELGHVTAVPSGAPCECGGAGCLETVASVGAVLDAYRTAGGRADDLAAFHEALAAGDAAARAVLAVAGAHIGTVLAAVCNAIGPGVIVIGGELARTGEALTEPVEKALAAHIMPASRDRVVLRNATLGATGGALGAIALVLHESPLLSHYPAEADPEDESCDA
ncbi:ROK family protein [Streptomyces sp. MAR4 CNX-425]|uniref:ROK family protein n=1 Tax=Streptomyces sp. MAR4 CNX-425 TaxID=3406343 RepID=UPI003B5034F5